MKEEKHPRSMFVKEGEGQESEEDAPQERPEDSIPDLPENQKAREFLRKAPTKGLWMPMGMEVKVMQCFRCKAFGHRSGDRECPLNKQGNIVIDSARQAREDPMSGFVAKKSTSRMEKYERVLHLQLIMEEIREEEIEKKKRKRKHISHRKEKHR